MSGDEKGTTYELRTSVFFATAMAGLAILCVVPIVLILTSGADMRQAPILSALSLVLPTIAPIWWFGSTAYRIKGGRATLSISSDAIELIGKTSLRFPRDELRVGVRIHNVEIRAFLLPIGTVENDIHLTLQAGSESIVLSRRLFVNPSEFKKLLTQLGYFQIAPAEVDDMSAKEVRTQEAAVCYAEAKLDAELDAID